MVNHSGPRQLEDQPLLDAVLESWDFLGYEVAEVEAV